MKNLYKMSPFISLEPFSDNNHKSKHLLFLPCKFNIRTNQINKIVTISKIVSMDLLKNSLICISNTLLKN